MDSSLVFTKMVKGTEVFAHLDKSKDIQSQLQGMVGGHSFEVIDKFHAFCMWDEQFEECREDLSPISMEQLWLCYVMKTLHSKMWNGNEWINDKA